MPVSFNPQAASIPDLQAILFSGNDEQVQSTVFATLAVHTPEEITTGLDEAGARKIQEFVKLRDREILTFVRALNNVGELRSDLEAEHRTYTTYKQALRDALSASYIESSIRRECSEIATSIGSQASAKYMKFLDRTPCKFPPSPNGKHSLSSSVDQLRSKIKPLIIPSSTKEGVLFKLADLIIQTFEQMFKNAMEYIEHVENFTEALQECIVDGISYDTLKVWFETTEDFVPFSGLFEVKFPIAQQKAEETIAKRLERIERMKAELTEQLTLVQSSYEHLQVDSTYQTYQKAKEELREKVSQLSTFCKVEEITGHTKMTNGLKARFNKMINT